MKAGLWSRGHTLCPKFLTKREACGGGILAREHTCPSSIPKIMQQEDNQCRRRLCGTWRSCAPRDRHPRGWCHTVHKKAVLCLARQTRRRRQRHAARGKTVRSFISFIFFLVEGHASSRSSSTWDQLAYGGDSLKVGNPTRRRLCPMPVVAALRRAHPAEASSQRCHVGGGANYFRA